VPPAPRSLSPLIGRRPSHLANKWAAAAAAAEGLELAAECKSKSKFEEEEEEEAEERANPR